MPESRVFPVTTIRVSGLEQVFSMAASTENPNVYVGAVTLPANTTKIDKTYTLTVYANDVATLVSCAVTVAGDPNAPDQYYAPTSITPDTTTLGSTGGTVNLTITYNTP